MENLFRRQKLKYTKIFSIYWVRGKVWLIRRSSGAVRAIGSSQEIICHSSALIAVKELLRKTSAQQQTNYYKTYN